VGAEDAFKGHANVRKDLCRHEHQTNEKEIMDAHLIVPLRNLLPGPPHTLQQGATERPYKPQTSAPNPHQPASPAIL
jgi:hypothetical protein